MIQLYYVTCAHKEEAEQIATTLLEEKHIACANILPEMTSVYRWEGQVEKGSESVLILKSTQDKKEAIQKRVAELHSYEVPCIIELSVESCNSSYADWLVSELI